MAQSVKTEKFKDGRPSGVSNVTRDGAGSLQSWIENGFTCSVRRNGSGLPVVVQATSPAIRFQQIFVFDGSSRLIGTSGDIIPTVFSAELCGAGTGSGGGGSTTIVNDLVTGGTTAALSAQMGVTLKGLTDTNAAAIASMAGALNYQTTWNASTNSPALPAAAAGNKGYYWIVSVAGATSQGGITDWQVGDWVVSNGATYTKVDNSDLFTDAGVRNAVMTGMSASGTALPTASDTTLSSFSKLLGWAGNLAANVRGVALTGLSVATNAAVVAGDTILAGIGKLQAQVTAILTTLAGKADNVVTSVTLTDASTVTLDANGGTVVDFFLTATNAVGGSRAYVVANAPDGWDGTLFFKQPATGGPCVLAPGAGISQGGGTAAYSTSNNAVDVVGLTKRSISTNVMAAVPLAQSGGGSVAVPTITWAVANAVKNKIVGTPSIPLYPGSVPAAGDFTANNGSGWTVSSVAFNGGNIELTMGTDAVAGQTLRVTHVQGTSRLLSLVNNQPVAAFTNAVVTNNVSGGASLTMGSTSSTAAADLTALAGSGQWAKFGMSGDPATTAFRKTGGAALISELTNVGGGSGLVASSAYPTHGTFTWTDGGLSAPVGAADDGQVTNGGYVANGGVSVGVTVGTASINVRVYVIGYGAPGTITVTAVLSDGSATVSPVTLTGTGPCGYVDIVVSAGSGGQTLTITPTIDSTAGSDGGTAGIAAVVVS